MRKLLRWMLLLLLPALGLFGSARAQNAGSYPPPNDIIFSRHRQFWIPFSAGAGKQRLKQLQLYVSKDQGKSWQPSAVAAPDQEKFRFLCEGDGLYWFTVQTLDVDNRVFPERIENAQPSLKVIVDTAAPVVHLRPLLPNNNEVGVSWEIHDEYLDLSAPDALRLDFRVQGQQQWMALPVRPGQTQYYWNPLNNGILDVRLRARDRAGNESERIVQTSLNGQAGPPAPGFNPNQAPVAGVDPDRRFVNSKRITLNYEIKDKGPSGVSAIELWYTMDARSWNLYTPAKQGEEAAGAPIVFNVEQEGVYGLTLVAKSGVGLGQRPPQIGDRPQMWVEVDITKPLVKIENVQVGQGMDKGKLFVTWSASDRNLAQQPITLSYGQAPTGPWTPITDKMLNTGRHVWTMPGQIPYQFHLRVEAVDRAGNIGEAITQNLVKVDLSQPSATITGVAPGR